MKAENQLAIGFREPSLENDKIRHTYGLKPQTPEGREWVERQTPKTHTPRLYHAPHPSINVTN